MTAIEAERIAIAQHRAGTTSYTAPTWYVGLAGGTGAAAALATGDPTGFELTSSGYARVALAWTENASNSDIPENTADATFTASSSWAERTHWFLATSGTAGAATVREYGALSAGRTLNANDVIRFVAGAIKLATPDS